ncbi:uncharacterized protein [Spinacia oleracea]|uniref:N-acetyltransferase domain-containing protein n=1 Tax=Spinacia oleracea TaxID=3562 RepID=A0ABM3RNN6_SPIOL|nr:uncharacterized protein LOC130470721 [Spinacia oleracea]
MPEITLRPYKLSDVDDFIRWACNSEVLQYINLQFWVNVNSSREQVVTYFNEVVITHPWYQAICLDGQAIGYVVLEREPGKYGLDRGRAKLSYALGREYWGRGITTIAVKTTIPTAFRKVPDLVRIEALVDIENEASERVLKKVGFVKEGLLRKYVMVVDGEGIDLNIFSILPNDPILN